MEQDLCRNVVCSIVGVYLTDVIISLKAMQIGAPPATKAI
jgi:hypothetical protein